ncbi:hypothetical protein [Sphingomonas sp. HMP6]|nr:hypothetical protein [Sphingomonas sp. HMP6]
MIAPNSGIASFLAPDRSKLTVPVRQLRDLALADEGGAGLSTALAAVA